MIFASKTTLSQNNFKILRHKVTKNLTNLPRKFCESPLRGQFHQHLSEQAKWRTFYRFVAKFFVT